MGYRGREAASDIVQLFSEILAHKNNERSDSKPAQTIGKAANA
jgi:hypothetical protein